MNKEKSMDRKIRFGIIGCGAIAQWHITAINAVENAELTAVMDANPSFAQMWGAKYGVPYFFSVEDLLNQGNVDAVSICTPSGLHAELAIKALQAGKHVVVEKPMAITSASLEALLQAERESMALLCPISQLRSMPDIRKAKKFIEDGAIGKLVMADLSMKYYRSPQYYEEKKWRGTWAMDGGGALMNQGIHGVDLMRYLCGEVVQMSAQTGTLFHTIETEDTLAASFTFAHGGLGVLTATTSVFPGFRRRLEICGTDGSLVLEESQLVQLSTRSGITLNGEKKEMKSGSSDPGQIDYEPHILQYRDITRAILTGTGLSLTSEDAAATVRLVLDLYCAAGNYAEEKK